MLHAEAKKRRSKCGAQNGSCQPTFQLSLSQDTRLTFSPIPICKPELLVASQITTGIISQHPSGHILSAHRASSESSRKQLLISTLSSCPTLTTRPHKSIRLNLRLVASTDPLAKLEVLEERYINGRLVLIFRKRPYNMSSQPLLQTAPGKEFPWIFA